MIRLDADQILYIESRGHTIIYHTEIGEYAERGSLKSAEEKLAQKHYYKCNNCYLVNLAHIVHAGDSRAYLWHGGAIRQLTRDHSMVQQLVDSGQITREQAALHPQKNLITRALGVSANIVPEYNRCEVVPGDLLLLCTDGLTNMVPDAELALLLQESAFFDAPGVLVDRALKGGGQDNITVLLLGVETTEETNG